MHKKNIMLPLAVAISLFINSASADTLTELQQCAQTKDSLVRLVCYDNVMKSLNSLPVTFKDEKEVKAIKAVTVDKVAKNTAYRPSVAQPVVENVQTEKEKSFGQEHLKKHKEPVVEDDEDIVMTVQSVKKSVKDRRIITFKNGQVWKQSDTEYINLGPDDEVKLSKGLFSVIYLQKVGQNRKIKVKRQK